MGIKKYNLSPLFLSLSIADTDNGFNFRYGLADIMHTSDEVGWSVLPVMGCISKSRVNSN